jgi:hypothetical protein
MGMISVFSPSACPLLSSPYTTSRRKRMNVTGGSKFAAKASEKKMELKTHEVKRCRMVSSA